MKHRKSEHGFSAGKMIASVLLVLLLAGLLFFALRQQKNGEVIEGAGTSEHAIQTQLSLEYNGQSRPLKKHLQSVFIMGTDKFSDAIQEKDMELFYNDMQADLQVVLVFDTDAKTCTPIQINRDTMCDVYWLSVNGKVGGTTVSQIALSHVYGSGKQDSCVNSRNTISHLMFDAPIGNYISFTMDAVPAINDLVGGVTVTVPETLEYLQDPVLVPGKTVTLHGDKALTFVRSRETEPLDANLQRMERQREFLSGFTTAARTALRKDPDLFVKGFDTLDPYMVTDLTVNEMSTLADMLAEYEILPVVTPEGSLKFGEKFREFTVDQDSLWNIVTAAYCE